RQVGDVDVSDEGAAMRDGADQVLASQALEGFPDRRPADLQLLAEARLIDHRTGRHLQAHDPLQDAAIRLLALGPNLDRFSYRHSPPRVMGDMRPIYRRGT